MILQSLTNYYDRLAADSSSGIAPEGYSSEKISFCLVLNPQGRLVDVKDLREPKGKKNVPRAMLVPGGGKRTSGIKSFTLWDNTGYVLGASGPDGKDSPEKLAAKFSAFKTRQTEFLAQAEDEGVRALCRFLEQWNPEDAPSLRYWEEMAGANLVFQLEGEQKYLHERSKVRAILRQGSPGEGAEGEGFCLVSGELKPIARLHPAIKGVWGAQTMGAALSSFNLDAFTSHGKEQNYNAPVGQDAAFAYATALNHLLRQGSRQRLQIGDATTVFWTERPSPAEDFVAAIFSTPRTEEKGAEAEDHALVQKTRGVLEAIRQGRHPPDLGDPEVPFYILGLGPNASRLSVRFWHVGTVGELAENLGQHFADLELERQYTNEPEFPDLWRLLIQLTPHREGQKSRSEDIPPPLAAAFMRALLTGADYPPGLYSGVLGRFRADHAITYLRVALLKACMVRRAR